MVRDKSFYRWFFRLVGFLALQSLIAYAVNLADNLMLGSYNEAAMSGATLVNQNQYLLMTLVMGLSSGVTILCSQYWGKKETGPIVRIISLGLKFSLAVGLVFTIITGLFPRQVMTIYTNEPLILEQGVQYLRLMCFTYVIYSVSNMLMISFRSVETTIIGPIMSGATLVINICVNYFLIFGNGGAPELGITGAAVATLISRSTELVIILVYIRKIDKKLQMKFRQLVKFDFYYIKDYLKVAIPVTFTGGMWGVGQTVQAIIMGHMGAVMIGANSIASNVYEAVSVMAQSGCTGGASIITGKTIGEGREDLIRPYAKTMQKLFLIIGAVTGLILFLLRDFIIGVYNVSPETAQLARIFLTILCFTVVGTAYEYPTGNGIIAGGGDVRTPLIVDNVFIWCVTLPAAALSAFVFGGSTVVTFFCLKMDQLWKCIPYAIQVNRFKWMKKLTR